MNTETTFNGIQFFADHTARNYFKNIMKNSRLKKIASQVPVPQTRADMENLVAQIAALKREEARLTLRMDNTVAKVKADFGEQLDAIEAQYRPLLDAAETWATNHPAEFGKAKSIKFREGVAGFRTGTPKLILLNRKWTWAKCLEAAQRLIPAFIRNKPELDKEAILAQRDEPTLQYAIEACGMAVDQDENFFVDADLTTVEKREVAK